MKSALFVATVLILASCSNQEPAPSHVILPEQIGPATDVLEVWAEVRETRVPIQDSILIYIHVRNPTPDRVEVASACVGLMYLTAFRGSVEVGLDGSGACRTALSTHAFEPGEERVIIQRAWARYNEVFERGIYFLKIGTHAYEGVPEPGATFEVR